MRPDRPRGVDHGGAGARRMSLLALTLIVMAVLSAGYLLYGTFVARQYRLDPSAVTPASQRNDGVDFIPTRPFYLMGQHFSAIAAAGPIVGPIAACMAFGWLPCVLWIVAGVILIGAVHDFSALVASVRHGANSIAEIARENLGQRAFVTLVAFIWLSLLYVITAFTDVTANSFIGTDPDLAALAPGGEFDRGGAVAAASTMYLLLALIMGPVQRFLRPPMWLVTLVFVPATLGVVWLGTKVSTVLVFDARVWYVAILVYCFVASLLPMWVLQQPRGYLGGFVLYLAIGVGVAGLLFGGFTVEQPAVRPLADYGAWLAGAPDAPPMTALLFPFLFVTIACGACSGFHGLVCGGTTSKQIARETHCKPIGFGAMLLEGFVAVIALATIMIVARGDAANKTPNVVYGDGLARFMTVFLGPDWLLFAKTFGTMAVATFVFDTLDISTRLGRYLLQELTGRTSRLAGVVAAAATAGIPLALLFAAEPRAWFKFWVLFGTSNQLLAGLTLLGVTVWLHRTGRKCWFTLVPTVFILTVTVTALVIQIVAAWRGLRARPGSGVGSIGLDATLLNGVVGLALLGLAAVFIVEALRTAGRHRAATGGPARPAVWRAPSDPVH